MCRPARDGASPVLESTRSLLEILESWSRATADIAESFSRQVSVLKLPWVPASVVRSLTRQANSARELTYTVSSEVLPMLRKTATTTGVATSEACGQNVVCRNQDPMFSAAVISSGDERNSLSPCVSLPSFEQRDVEYNISFEDISEPVSSSDDTFQL